MKFEKPSIPYSTLVVPISIFALVAIGVTSVKTFAAAVEPKYMRNRRRAFSTWFMRSRDAMNSGTYRSCFSIALCFKR